MGNETGEILYTDIDPAAYYVCEVEWYWGGLGVTGCQRPYQGIIHDIVPGDQLRYWIQYSLDCTDGWTLVWGSGDAQRLIKIFGPYADMHDAQQHNW